MEIPDLTRAMELLRRLRFFLHRERYTAELEEEMRLHQELRAERHAAEGVPAPEARRLARRQFGRAVAHVEASRDAWGARAMEVLVHEVRYAARNLLRTPGLSIAVVLTLALGLGANAAIFSVLDRLFFRMPPGVEAPKEVLRLYDVPAPHGGTQAFALAVVDYQRYVSIRAAVGNSGEVAVYMWPQRSTFGRDSSHQVFGSFAGLHYFSLLGVRPALGRFFAPDEQQVESPADVMVIGYDLWQRAFGGDSSVLGRVVPVRGHSYTIIGVAPRGFKGVDLDATDYWVPLSSFRGFGPAGIEPRPGATRWYRQRGTMFLSLLARAHGVPPALLAARATVGLRRDARVAPWHDTTSTIATGSLIAARGPAQSPQEYSLSARLAAVAVIVLLIACANVANLLLARATQRRRELAVRLAMGISRRRLAAMLLTESALLAIVAGAAALLTSMWAGALMRALLLPSVHWQGSMIDLRIVLFTTVAALVAALAAGFAPALQATRTDLTTALKSGAREGGGRRGRLRASLVVVQSALSALLLVGAGLFVRSLHNVASAHTGYDVDRLTFVSANGAAWRDSTVLEALPSLARRLAAAPGVERVALVGNPPIYAISFEDLFRPNGDSLTRRGTGGPTVTAVSPSYFATAGTRILRGRVFSGTDLRGAGRELVVNETMARQYWPDEDPIGQCLRLEKPTAPCFTVVGVVEDALRMQLLEAPAPSYFVPASMTGDGFLRAGWVMVRAAPSGAESVALIARSMIRQLLPRATPEVLPMSELLDPQLRPWRLGAELFTAFGVLALLVAAMGVYSTLTYAVSQRTNEIGVRVALGAQAADVMRLIVGSGVRVVAAGVAAGIALAIAAGRAVASLVYGISPHDPLTMLLAAAVLLLSAAIAAAVPAWRAARVDPVTALHMET